MATIAWYNNLAEKDVQRLRVVADRGPDPGQRPVTKDATGKLVPKNDHEAIAALWKFIDGKYSDFP